MDADIILAVFSHIRLLYLLVSILKGMRKLLQFHTCPGLNAGSQSLWKCLIEACCVGSGELRAF
jgi:hypothetical protein